jgi:Fic family protein
VENRISYIWQHPEWPKFSWNDSKIIPHLSKCRLSQGKLISRIESLGISIYAHARAEILSVEAIKTSEIEGEKLDVKSLRSSVSRRLGLSPAGLSPDKRIEGLLDILMDATEHFDNPLTESRILGWHAALFPSGFSGLSEISVGKFRSGAMSVVSGKMGKEKIHFEAPPASSLASEMKAFLSWWKNGRDSHEGIISAAVAHLYFVTIHPFDDGNGRIARVLTDMALAQDDKQPIRYYSLSRQIMEKRKDYYNILERTQKGSCDITDWIIWFLGCFTRAIQSSEEILSNVFLRAEFSRRPDIMSLPERQRSILLRVLEPGFEGVLTTRKYMAFSGVSRATAFRELDELFSKGILTRRGQGRSAGYEVIL